MKRPQLKFVLLAPALAFIAVVANTGYSQSCMGSSITSSDIDIVPEKLQVGKSARVRVSFLNSGRCQWLKDAVKLSIIVKTKPPGSPSSFREIPTELPQRAARVQRENIPGISILRAPKILVTTLSCFNLRNAETNSELKARYHLWLWRNRNEKG